MMICMDLLKNKGIVPYLNGGLGNQLFKLAAGFTASKLFNCPLYILPNSFESNEHNIHKIDYTIHVFKYLGISFPGVFFQKSILNEYGYNDHNSGSTYCFEYTSFDGCKPGLILGHYYQNYTYIENYEKDIRERIVKSLMESPYFKCTYSTSRAFMHIRRGDYVTRPDAFFLQPIEYYKNAVSLLLEKNPNIESILIISDDPEWVRQQDFFTQLPNAIILDNSNEVETICEMVCCLGGAICANSTFSWWGAFLGAYSARSPVIVPKKWYIDAPSNLFPSEWMQL